MITGLLLTLFVVSLTISQTNNTKAVEPFFTLVAKTGDPIGADYCNFVKQHVQRIGINLEVQVLDFPSLVAELMVFRNFDLCLLGLSGGGGDPDFSGVYDENGSLNCWGYDETMDWDPTLVLGERTGWGTNEWYMKKGTLIMPPDSEGRVNHYWAWEQHLMDKILPLKPMFSPRAYIAIWDNLQGYNYTDGIFQSFGKLSFDGTHNGQQDVNEVVINNLPWSDLNPMFQDDAPSAQISGAILDPLIFYDADLSVWPMIATSWTHINDTHIRITIREGIKWQPDPDGLFPDEYVDARDVYFTFYSWAHVSNDQQLFSWIDKMEIINDYTLDIYIDGDPTTPNINEPYAPYLPSLSTNIQPEHYLNQTQLGDGVTPDITHDSWTKYATSCFGTSVFEIDDFVEGVETTLKVYPDCWLMDPALASDPNLDWTRRFGDKWEIEKLRIRMIADPQTAMLEFEAGKLDMVACTAYPNKRDQYLADESKNVQSDTQFFFNFVGFNMRTVRDNIGNPNICPGDNTLSIGLAIRKAISYAIDKNEINAIEHRGEWTSSDWPIHTKMGVWCNPDIIRYNFDLDKAREYMVKAGFDLGTTTTGTPGFTILITITSLISTAVAAVIVIKKKH